METRKKGVQQKNLERREQGFNVYVSGANAVRVDDLRKKEKQEIAQHRSKSKNTRKKWEVEGDERPRRSEEDDEDLPKKEVQEAPVKRERRGWGVPRPDPVFEGEENKVDKLVSPKRDIQEDIPDYSDKSQEVESRENVDIRRGEEEEEEEENEEIKNFISSMKSGDIEKLRQSVADSLKEDEFRKTLQGLKAEQPQISNEKPLPKNKRNPDEVEEEIAEDIDENPAELDQDYNKSTNRVESSYYAGRPISVRKARPISATYHDISGSKPVEPVYAGIPFQTKNIAEPSFELDYRKTVDLPPQQSKQSTNPFKGPISPTNKRPGMKEKEKSDKEIPSKGPTAIIKSSKPMATEESVIQASPVKEEGERKSAKGENGLLKRIESLDEKKKQLLESILDKIEKGEYNKEMLLNLDFLNIKSEVSPQKEVRRSRELKEKEQRDQKEKQREQQKRDSRDKKDRHKHVPTRSELTLPSNVESKISKFIESSPLLEKKSGSKITDLPKIEPKTAPLKTEEAIPEKISLPKANNETPKISTTDNSGKSSSRNNLQDSLEQNTFTKRASNGANYNSNPEPVHLPSLPSKSKNQASANLKTEPASYPELKIGETTSQPQEHQLQFRIMSTWGSISQAGLTDIQLFDEEGKKIEVKPSDFHLKNCGLSSIKTINRLVDGVIYTTEDEHMWLCSMPAPPMTAEMFITLKNVRGIGAFRIWNYNKSLIDSIKGIKKLEIIHNKNLVWIGNINRGPGNEFEIYHTEILLKQGITLPPVEQPQIINPVVETTTTTEPEKSKDSDVPIWLQDNWKGGLPPVASSFESRGSVGTGLSRREHERSASALTSGGGAYLGLEPTKSLADKVHNNPIDLKLPEVVKSATTTDVGKSIDVNKSASRIRNQPRSEGPMIKDVFDQNPVLPSRRAEERTPKASSTANDQKENTNVQSSGKKDDNSSINSVEFFNITNFGRLRPAKRESLMQVFNLQQDVIQKVQDVQKRLDFKTTPITEEMDILTQFDKGLKEDQPKLKIPQQSVEQASANLGKKKEEPSAGLTRKNPSIQSKTAVPDALDSLFSKGSATAKNATSNVEMETSATTKKIEKILYENKSFRIPELPKGRVIKICIYSTWGDAHYVGLNGIELFDDRGEAITLQDVNSQIKANPPDINCLPGYGKDPRTIDKIVDGTYLTCDDLHVWLAPFTQGRENTIEIDFRETKTISMIRIWNYNKSRIHSYRGARDIAIKLDETPIFLGEISKAPGSLKGAEDSCEYLLFTENDNILSKIESRDWLNRVPKNENIKPDLNSTIERPMTGTRQFDENDLRDIKDAFNQPLLGPDGRPMTMARINVNNQIRDQIEKNKKELKRLEQQEKLRQDKEKANISKALSIISSSSAQYAEIKCKSLVITISKTWGDAFYVGLTGLEVYDGEGNKIILSMKNLNAKPKDMNTIPGYSGDHRTLDKLINHDNLTIKDENMWLIPFTPNQNHYIYITFDEAKTVSGIKFWNYNKGEDGSYRGAKYINISADGIMLTPPSGVLLRKAPGHDYHDYSQFVPVPFFDGWDEETVKLYKNIKPQPMSGFLMQEYDTPEFPTGFCFKLKLLSTWGDFNYVGLNGIEFYDQKGEVMLTKAQKDYKLSAEPSSVSCLAEHENDIRTIDKLVNGNNNTFDDRNMWLAPLLQDRRDEGVFKVDHNEIVFTFDKPKIISCIKFWNYSKTPIRGVREVEIFCDDIVIYRGYLRMATSEAESKNNMNLTTTVLFTKNTDLIQKVDANIYTEEGKPQKVTLYNEKKLINPVNEGRPQTHATLERPTTSVKGLMPY